MSRQIIDYEDKNYRGMLVNTFWGGKEKKECVQFTPEGSYAQMTRGEAIEFCKFVIKKLKDQIEHDNIDPPWWQKIDKESG